MSEYTILTDEPLKHCECCGALLLRDYPDDKTCGSCDLLIDIIKNDLNEDKNRVWSYGEGLRTLTANEKRAAKYLGVKLGNNL